MSNDKHSTMRRDREGAQPSAPSGGIIRTKKDKGYFVASNRPFNDSRLSWAARGVLAYLFSKPDDWELRFSDLLNQGDLGRDALRGVLKELQRYGYLVRQIVRGAGGRVAWESVVYETPVDDPQEEIDRHIVEREQPAGDTDSPSPENPSMVDDSPPSPENPSTAERSTVRASIQKVRKKPSTESPKTEQNGTYPPTHTDGALALAVDRDRAGGNGDSGGRVVFTETAAQLRSLGMNDRTVAELADRDPAIALPLIQQAREDFQAGKVNNVAGAAAYRLRQIPGGYAPAPAERYAPPLAAPPSGILRCDACGADTPLHGPVGVCFFCGAGVEYTPGGAA